LAKLAISLGSTAPGSDYGHIHFSNPLIMIGTFSVSTRSGFVPSPGDTFDVLSYPSATNEFTCFSGLDLGGGVLLLPQLFITRSPTGVRVTWPLGFPGWVLQSTTNLSSTNWSSVSAQCDNQALLPVTAPKQFFRLSQ